MMSLCWLCTKATCFSFVHVENKMCRSGRLCSTTALHYNDVCHTFDLYGNTAASVIWILGHIVTLIVLWWSVQPLVTVCSPPEGKHRTRYQRIHLNWILKQVQLKSIRKKWNRRIKVFISLKVSKVTLPAEHETEEHLVYLPCWY